MEVKLDKPAAVVVKTAKTRQTGMRNVYLKTTLRWQIKNLGKHRPHYAGMGHYQQFLPGMPEQ